MKSLVLDTVDFWSGEKVLAFIAHDFPHYMKTIFLLTEI